METANAVIPFEKQLDAPNNRMCGAACLSMVYRSFGQEVKQEEIWPNISKVNRFGSLASTTHLMVQDAMNRGFAAIAIQAKHPLEVLRICREQGFRAILNHRLNNAVSTGHYSVLVDLNGARAVLHDPHYGPSRQVALAELLELWQPRFPESEIVGHVVIAVAKADAPALKACEFCRCPIPPKVECPRCMKPVPLLPNLPLMCMNSSCVARMWNYVCCPWCDFTWNFSLNAEESKFTAAAAALQAKVDAANPPEAAKPPQPDTAKDPWKLEQLFTQLDKFCAHMMSLPVAANNEILKRQIDYIKGGKEKLTLAQVEFLANQKLQAAQLDKLRATAAQKKEAIEKRKAELNKPSPPLDGNELGRALLKNLGFIK